MGFWVMENWGAFQIAVPKHSNYIYLPNGAKNSKLQIRYYQ